MLEEEDLPVAMWTFHAVDKTMSLCRMFVRGYVLATPTSCTLLTLLYYGSDRRTVQDISRRTVAKERRDSFTHRISHRSGGPTTPRPTRALSRRRKPLPGYCSV